MTKFSSHIDTVRDNKIDYEFLDLIYENQKEQRVKIKKYIIHPNYTSDFENGLSIFEYDIAVLITENIGEFNDLFNFERIYHT